MNSRRQRQFAILGLALFLAWTLWSRTHSEPNPPSAPAVISRRPKIPQIAKAPSPKEAVKAITPLQISPPPQANALKPLPPAKPQEDPHKPPASSVPFELMNGWVVAYGDIAIGKPTIDDFPKDGFIEAPKLHLWEQGVIPFSIHSSLPDPERVLRVIAYFNAYSPIRFVPYSGQSDSLVFFPMDGLCLSYLGKIGGNQPIYLDFHCSDREITHEIMHALGFIHEHSRVDRDQYVRVNWKNIEEDKLSQFDLSPISLNEPLKGRPFDYHSVMLYPSTAFAKDRSQPTITSTNEQPIDPAANGLSFEDLERLKIVYPLR